MFVSFCSLMTHSLARRSLLATTALLIALLGYSPTLLAEAKTDKPLKVQIIAQQLASPWGMTWLSSHELLITEKRGTGWRIDTRSGQKQVINSWPKEISSSGQGGLLDVVADPDFAVNGRLFFSFSHRQRSSDITTRVASARLQNNQLIEWKVLLTATPHSDSGHHFGSRLAIKNNHLFVTVGDRGERHRAQDLSDHAGKVHRINLDGSIPPDNPFIGQRASNNKPALSSIYSYGHRNPQGLYIDQQGVIWLNEHGPRGGDELNRVEAGRNYGWPIITYGREYWGPKIGEGTHKEGLQQPEYVYTPSIAPSGLVRYEHHLFPQWHGDFLIGALKLRHLNRLTPATAPTDKHAAKFAEYRYLEQYNWRIRDIETAADGAIYLLTDAAKGLLLKLTP